MTRERRGYFPLPRFIQEAYERWQMPLPIAEVEEKRKKQINKGIKKYLESLLKETDSNTLDLEFDTWLREICRRGGLETFYGDQAQLVRNLTVHAVKQVLTNLPENTLLAQKARLSAGRGLQFGLEQTIRAREKVNPEQFQQLRQRVIFPTQQDKEDEYKSLAEALDQFAKSPNTPNLQSTK